MPTCRHGTYTHRARDLSRSEDRVADRHLVRRGCGGTVFGHPGTWLGIFAVVCCTKCGQVS